MKNKNLRFRPMIISSVHLASWIIYLYLSYYLNESKFGTGLFAVVLFPLYGVTFYSIYFCLKLLVEYKKPLLSGCGFFLFLVLILPLTYGYINMLLPTFGLRLQEKAVPFHLGLFILQAYTGVYRMAFYALLAYLATLMIGSKRMLTVFKRQNLELKIAKLGAQLTSHTQFDLLHRIITRFSVNRDGFEEYVEGVAEMHGYSAVAIDQRLVPLTGELEQVERLALLLDEEYFLRHPDWLSVNGDFPGALIPPMVLVSLLENAYKYADLSKSDAIKMKIKAMEAILLISCENDIVMTSLKPSLGLGNKNLKARLEVIFGQQAHYQTFEKNGRYHVQITLHHTQS